MIESLAAAAKEVVKNSSEVGKKFELPSFSEKLGEPSIKSLKEADKPLVSDVKEIKTNSQLDGKLHPATQIPFNRKEIVNPDGEIIRGVFPDFSSEKMFEAKLPENLYQSTDPEQFKFCDQELKSSFDNKVLDTSNFSDRQLEQISNGDKPEKFTWHHSEQQGILELVPSDIHADTGHTGGRFIWGGGTDAR